MEKESTINGKWILCEPQYSDGRHQEVIDEIVATLRAIPGVCVLGYDLDARLNRTIVTWAAPAELFVDACFRSIAKAVQIISIDQPRGEHPRIGVAGVCPLVPLFETPLDVCVQLAHELGKRVGSELTMPVYLYEAAATQPERKEIGYIRRCEFEQMQYVIGEDPAWQPDYGPNCIHPTAGAIAVGARFFVIRYNIHLDTTDVVLGWDIAQKIRSRNGGLPHVKAIARFLPERQMVEVATNLTDYRSTGISTVLQRVTQLAGQSGVTVAASEIVGFIPAEALEQDVRATLLYPKFAWDKVMEHKLQQMQNYPLRAPRPFLEALSLPQPTPAAGSATAMTAAMVAALVNKLAEISLHHAKDQEVRTALTGWHRQLLQLQQHLALLVEEDADAYQSFIAACHLPEATVKEARESVREQAAVRSILVPLDTMRQTLAVLKILPGLLPHLPVSAIPDLQAAWHLGFAALQGTAVLGLANLALIQDKEVKSAVEKEVNELVNQGKTMCPKSAKEKKELIS